MSTVILLLGTIDSCHWENHRRTRYIPEHPDDLRAPEIVVRSMSSRMKCTGHFLCTGVVLNEPKVRYRSSHSAETNLQSISLRTVSNRRVDHTVGLVYQLPSG